MFLQYGKGLDVHKIIRKFTA